MDSPFNLEELAHDLIPSWATSRGINNRNKQKLKILEELGELAQAYLRNDPEQMRQELGDVFVTIAVYYHINGDKPSVNAKGRMYAQAEIADLMILCAKTKSVAILHAIATKIGLDLEQCANIAYQKILYREGKTINGIFYKNEIT